MNAKLFASALLAAGPALYLVGCGGGGGHGGGFVAEARPFVSASAQGIAPGTTLGMLAALNAMDPANHPVPGDRRFLLACHGLRASRNARLPPKRQAILRAWFLAVGLLPRALARAVISWKLQAASRPWALKWAAKAIRAAAR